MKKKVFFIISSFAAGGSERVFWLLSQAFDRSLYEVTVVLLNTQNNAFSMSLPGVRVIDLKTVKASKSFLPLLKLLKKEHPFAIYSTGSHINMLVGVVAMFTRVPNLIARSTNIPGERSKFTGLKSKIVSQLEVLTYRKFDFLVCQSAEMRKSWLIKSVIPAKKLITIPNPISNPGMVKQSGTVGEIKRLIIVARMSSVKGHKRLLDVLHQLPATYRLTIAGGDGGEKQSILEKVRQLGLESRVDFLGQIDNVPSVVAQHELLVLPSFTEGFPNVVLEALSVGIPVVTFRVGGVSDFIVDGFNGYIVEQGDLDGFKKAIIKTITHVWDHNKIAGDIQDRFALANVARQYEQLITLNI